MSKSDVNSRQILLMKNIIKGKLAEQITKNDYEKNGFRIINSNKGCDFIAEKKIPGTARVYLEYVEVKTGCAKQTKIQKKTMKRVLKQGCNYTVFHVSNVFLERYLEANDEAVII